MEGIRPYDLPWAGFIYQIDNSSTAYRKKSVFVYYGFDKVYKETPRKDFHLDWLFIAIPPNGPHPEYVVNDDICTLVLWKADKLIDDNAVDTNQIGWARPTIFGVSERNFGEHCPPYNTKHYVSFRL